MILAAALATALSATAAAPPCAATTERLVRTWIDSYNKGDAARLDRAVFARAPAFQWYSDLERIGAAAQDRTSLRAFFAARHAAGERFRLKAYKFNGYDRPRRLGHFELTLRRRTAAAPRWRTAVGKGAASCAQRRIIVTSIGGDAPGA